MQIITNNHWRDLISLEEAASFRKFDRSDFDYIEEDDKHSLRLFLYRGCWYDVNEFIPWDQKATPGWQAVHSDSYFSGVAVTISDDGDYVKVATILS